MNRWPIRTDVKVSRSAAPDIKPGMRAPSRQRRLLQRLLTSIGRRLSMPGQPSLPALLAIATVLLSAPVFAQLDERQGKLLSNNCLQCHARPGIGVPLMGNAPDWTERNRKGMDALLVNVVQGMRGMPPLGYCSACSEQDFRALIAAMSGFEGATK
jgi:cytochrome c5